MGGKRNKPGTPPHNQKITAAWKKQNSLASPLTAPSPPPGKQSYKSWQTRAQEASDKATGECWAEALEPSVLTKTPIKLVGSIEPSGGTFHSSF
jgi:hypothetical protein